MPPLCHMALGAVAGSRALPSKPASTRNSCSLDPHGCATHVVPKTPFCRFRSRLGACVPPSARDRQGQKSLLGVAGVQGGRFEEVLQENWHLLSENLNDPGQCVELRAMVGDPLCPPLCPHQPGKGRSFTALILTACPLSVSSEKKRQQTEDPGRMGSVLPFQKVCVCTHSGEEHTAMVCVSQRTTGVGFSPPIFMQAHRIKLGSP